MLLARPAYVRPCRKKITTRTRVHQRIPRRSICYFEFGLDHDAKIKQCENELIKVGIKPYICACVCMYTCVHVHIYMLKKEKRNPSRVQRPRPLSGSKSSDRDQAHCWQSTLLVFSNLIVQSASTVTLPWLFSFALKAPAYTCLANKL